VMNEHRRERKSRSYPVSGVRGRAVAHLRRTVTGHEEPFNTLLGARLATMLIEGQMAKKTRLATVRRERPRKRAEQRRSIETRASILNAAIAEFAERGFEGASIRVIADRLGLQHPLITYHYRSKDILWRAAAEHAFAQIRAEWDVSAPNWANLSPLARLRHEYGTLFRYTVAFPEFHRFMRQETLTNNPRLKWVAETVLAPLLGRLLPQIAAAQKQGLLPAVDPILFHYMMVSLTATLSGFGPEMRMTSGLSSSDPKVVKAYWRLIDEMVFGKEGKRPASLAGRNTARGGGS
jgi:TetR/AcrR family transcriptional regulator